MSVSIGFLIHCAPPGSPSDSSLVQENKPAPSTSPSNAPPSAVTPGSSAVEPEPLTTPSPQKGFSIAEVDILEGIQPFLRRIPEPDYTTLQNRSKLLDWEQCTTAYGAGRWVSAAKLPAVAVPLRSTNILVTSSVTKPHENVRLYARFALEYDIYSHREGCDEKHPASQDYQLRHYSASLDMPIDDILIAPKELRFDLGVKMWHPRVILYTWLDANGNGICDERTGAQILDLYNGGPSTTAVRFEANQTVVNADLLPQNKAGCGPFDTTAYASTVVLTHKARKDIKGDLHARTTTAQFGDLTERLIPLRADPAYEDPLVFFHATEVPLPKELTPVTTLWAWLDRNGNDVCDEEVLRHDFDVKQGRQTDPAVRYGLYTTSIDLSRMQAVPADEGCANFSRHRPHNSDAYDLHAFAGYVPVSRASYLYRLTDLASQNTTSFGDEIKLHSGHDYYVDTYVASFGNISTDWSVRRIFRNVHADKSVH